MKFIKFLLLIAIFGYIFYGFDFEKIDFSKISLTSFLVTTFILFIGQVILSIRFMKIIDLKFNIAYETIVISNTLNMFLPARLGEVIKGLYLKKFYNYDYNKSISAVFIERFFDVIMLFLVILSWGYFYFTNEVIKNSIIVLSIFIMLTILFFNSKIVLKLFQRFEFLTKIYKNINLLFKKSAVLLFWSIVLWVCYLLSYISFFDFLTFNQVIELFIFSTIALAIPLAPGGIGTFEGIIVFYLGNYGISKEEAFLFASVYHIIILLVDLGMFYVLLWNKNLNFKELKGLK